LKTQQRIFISLLFISSIFATNSLSAQPYYVSTTGLDTNPGTEALPWKTVSKAASTLTAGQTAYIRGGTYNEKVTIANSGTPGNLITITAYPNETPIIDGTGTGTGSWLLFSIGFESYIKISGLKLQNGGMGMGNAASNVIIENNYFYNFSNPAISLSNCTNSIVKGNIVDRAVYTSWGECITFTQCDYIDVCNNEVKNGSPTNTGGGEGIDVKGSKHFRVFNNTIHDLPKKLGIYIDAYDGLDYDIQIFNNKVYNCTNGIVISSEKWNDMEKVWVYNNLTYDISGEGIKVVDYFNTNYRIKNIIIENNTMSACKGINIDAPNGSDFIIRNNILSNCSSSIIFTAAPANLTIANNLVYPGIVPGTGGILADPQFTNPATKDFTLKATSPAIDKGAVNNVTFDFNYNIRPVGISNDIGAYEYGSLAIATIPTVTKPLTTLVKSTVNQSTDDGTENTSTGVVTLTSTPLITNFTSTTSKTVVALRFTNVQVPKGATIVNAKIKVKLAVATTSNTDPIKINAEKTANSQTFTIATNSISSKARTTNAAYWLPGSISVGSLINTPCIDYVVGELVSNENWVSGNAMTFIFEYVSGAGRSLQFNAFDSGSGSAELSIEYSLDSPNSIFTINQSENAVKIFPNPATETITIDFHGKNYKSISVTDMLGKVICKKNIDNKSDNLVLNVQKWGKGVHLIKLHDNYTISTYKVLVN